MVTVYLSMDTGMACSLEVSQLMCMFYYCKLEAFCPIMPNQLNSYLIVLLIKLILNSAIFLSHNMSFFNFSSRVNINFIYLRHSSLVFPTGVAILRPEVCLNWEHQLILLSKWH